VQIFLAEYDRPPTRQEWRHARAHGLPHPNTLHRLGLTVEGVLEIALEKKRET
jgi:hypothetical protein